jgi:3-oxoacyl-(acyl-carrier-protein) synthase
MVCGAGEAPITPYIYGAFCATGFHSRHNDPEKAVKPYDLNADGMVLGEGGAVLILEDLHHALRRKAKIYGEVLSYSSLNEAFDLIEVDPNNGTMADNFKQALKRTNIDVKEIDYINAHGNGILSYDISETEAVKQVFGELAYDIPVTSIKPVTGHSIAPTSIWQIIATLLAMEKGTIPPTLNIQNPAPECNLNYVPNYFLKRQVRTALINAHGFGGRITALVLRRFFETIIK